MKRLGFTLAALLLAGAVLPAPPAWADPQVPTPNPAWRTPRADFVRTWHIFNDANLNGILDPGDQRVDSLQNWWTPVSAHTQHNYEIGPYGPGGLFFGPNDDKPSAPMNFASETDPNDNFWLPRAKNAVNFYMTYSQFDNNDWATFGGGGSTPIGKQVAAERNMFRNGWAMGWVSHDVTTTPGGDIVNDQSQAGAVGIDIYVHRGEGTSHVPGFGTSRANPQVAMSNDISNKALDNTEGPGTGTQWHPPQFDEATQTYSWAENFTRMTANGLNNGDLTDIVNSMETKEVDPLALAGADVVWAGRTPTEIQNNLTDENGDPYKYEDAFQERGNLAEGASDGGVISGLSGFDEYDPAINNWGGQQVIRIDISPETLRQGDPNVFGNITSVVFWDFGEFGSDQLHPRAIVLDLTNLAMFPEGRFYIAQVRDVPEPTSLALILVGGTVVLLRRRRKAA
jgi:hypothetical protein